MTTGSTAPIAAIVTAYRRVEAARQTIARIRACDPAPAEILVHVDGGEVATSRLLADAFPDIRILLSEANIGPGGARNALMAAAEHPVVASFDDDSYPIDADYFGRLVKLFAEFPAACVIDALVFHRQQAIEPDTNDSQWVADFSGGACAYRRSAFLETGGYVPLPVAYGMEEVDLGLRLHANGGRVLRSRQLRVFHDTDLGRHAAAAVTAASLTNIMLLAYLRYPRRFWGIAAVQCVKRIGWLLRNGRWTGIGAGLAGVPGTITMYRQRRQPVSGRALRSYWALRRNPVPAGRGMDAAPAPKD